VGNPDCSGGRPGNDPLFPCAFVLLPAGVLYKLAGPNVGLGRLAGCLLGSLTCYLIARLGATVAAYHTGVLAGLLAAVYWPFIYFDAGLLTVTLEAFLDVAMLLLLITAIRGGRWWIFLAAGIVWGLSGITRPNVLALAPGLVAWLWLAVERQGRLKRWLVATALSCAGAAVVVLPVTLRNYFVAGEFVLIASQGGVNFYIGNNPHSNGYTAVVPGTRADWWGGYEDTHRIVEHALGRTPPET
jgi:hypothetical protein